MKHGAASRRLFFGREDLERVSVRGDYERNSVLEMCGEFLREAAVLILVFVPLELYKTGTMRKSWFLGTITFSVVLLFSGIFFERIRP
jgi:hypothetical protein